DCGDNLEKRSQFTVYRLSEPELDPLKLGQKLDVPMESATYSYPVRPYNCETILTLKSGHLLFVSKKGGSSGLYITPKPFSPDSHQELELVGQYSFTDGGDVPNIFSLFTTAGSVSFDETYFV